MKNNIMKRIASCFCAFAFALAAIVVPLRVTQSENVAASAEITDSRVDIYLPFCSFAIFDLNGSFCVADNLIISIDYSSNSVALGTGIDMYRMDAILVANPIFYGEETYGQASYELYSGVYSTRGLEFDTWFYRTDVPFLVPEWFDVGIEIDINSSYIRFPIDFYSRRGDVDVPICHVDIYFETPGQYQYVYSPFLGSVDTVNNTSQYASFDCGVLPFSPYLLYEKNAQNSYQSGYATGQNVGYSQGYAIGYQDGMYDALEEGGTLTFRSLISAVIDVPLNAFRSLFSFEILGVDMLTFFSSLLTLGIILAVVRLIL